MTTLKQAQETGILDQFIAEREAEGAPDGDATKLDDLITEAP
jgi:hypothetical protein